MKAYIVMADSYSEMRPVHVFLDLDKAKAYAKEKNDEYYQEYADRWIKLGRSPIIRKQYYGHGEMYWIWRENGTEVT